MKDILTTEEVKTLIAEAMSARLGKVIDPANVTFRVEAHMEMVDSYEHIAPRGEFKGAKIKI